MNESAVMLCIYYALHAHLSHQGASLVSTRPLPGRTNIGLADWRSDMIIDNTSTVICDPISHHVTFHLRYARHEYNLILQGSVPNKLYRSKSLLVFVRLTLWIAWITNGSAKRFNIQRTWQWKWIQRNSTTGIPHISPGLVRLFGHSNCYELLV